VATPELSLTEWVVLALVGESPTHGFAVARELQAESDLGRILTVHRPLVYRALSRLQQAALVEEAATERGDAGPNRTVMRATRVGKAALKRWFVQPVDHIRDLRIEFLIKLRLTERRGNAAQPLVDAQRSELAPTFELLANPPAGDVVDQWRRQNAIAARTFLNDL
jgi:PadR family transcriptional regulator AphA